MLVLLVTRYRWQTRARRWGMVRLLLNVEAWKLRRMGLRGRRGHLLTQEVMLRMPVRLVVFVRET